MRFADIPGSAEVKAKLIRSVQEGKVAHAQLFAGKEGALNLPLALAYATYLHCQNKSDDSCGTCPACSKSLKWIHPDTHFVFPIGNIKGDKDEDRFKAEIMKTWRTFLIEQPFGGLNEWVSFYGGEDKQVNISREESREIIRALSLKSFESPFKIMIIWQPEFMHPSASNGILKILEEPPPNTFFLLVTNAADKLLPTILSRVQIVQVPLLADEELSDYLEKNTSIEKSRVPKVLQLADGNLGAALKLLDAEEDNDQDRFASWMRSCFKREYAQLLALSDEFHEVDKLQQRNFFQYSLNMLRETLLHRSGATTINRTKGNELKFIQDFSKVMTLEKIDRSCELIGEASYFLDRNGSAKMIFLDLSLQLSKVLNP